MQVLLKFMMCRVEKICFSAVTLVQKCMSSIVKAHAEKQQIDEKLEKSVKPESPVKLGLSTPSTPSKSGFGNIIEEIANDGTEVNETEQNSYYGLTEGKL